MRRDEPVGEQVQAQVGVGGVGRRGVEVVDDRRRPRLVRTPRSASARRSAAGEAATGRSPRRRAAGARVPARRARARRPRRPSPGRGPRGGGGSALMRRARYRRRRRPRSSATSSALSSPRVDRARPSRSRSTCRSSPTSTSSSPPSSTHGHRRVAAAQDVGHRRAAGARAPRTASPPRRARRSARGCVAGRELAYQTTRSCGCGNCGVVLDRRADGGEVERLQLASGRRRGSRICGLPIVHVLEAPSRRPRAVGPPGWPQRRARPMSTRQVVAEWIVGRISPAAVWIENCARVGPAARRRYRIASRAPLPDSSASEPSGLKIRRRATKPGLRRAARARGRRRRRRRRGGRTGAARGRRSARTGSASRSTIR